MHSAKACLCAFFRSFFKECNCSSENKTFTIYQLVMKSNYSSCTEYSLKWQLLVKRKIAVCLNHFHTTLTTDRSTGSMTKTSCGADCWTDHRLVVSKLNLRIQPARRPQGKKAPKRLDVSKLNHDSMRQAFINDISDQLGAMNLSSEDPEENWTVFQKVVHSSAATTIGHPSCKHQDWFDENDEEIKLLLEEKRCLHKAHQDDTSSVSKKAAYNNICKTVQNRLRDMQDSWLSKKAEEI